MSSSSDFGPVTHVIFDVDGLLLNTETLYTEATQRVADPFHKQFTWEVKEKQMGRRMREVADIVIRELDLPITIDQYLNEVRQHWEELFPTAQLMPGAERLVRHLYQHDIQMALASGGGRPAFELKTQQHREFFALFEHAVLATTDPEVKRGKPAPDVYQIAAQRFQHPPARPELVLTFEDAPAGVTSARAAGMQCVMVPDPRLSAELRQEATLVLPSLEAFRPELFGLPVYET